jgi:NitT/TauT family transport system substrate-binding protein
MKAAKLRKFAVLCSAALMLTAFLAGCGQKIQTVENGGEPRKALRKFVLPFTATGIGNPMVAIAYDLKYWEEEGLDVKLETLNTGGNVDQLMAVSTKKIDVANSGGTTAPLLFIEQGNNLVIIGGTMGEGAALAVRPEDAAQYANFNKDSLNGKRIGVRRANTGDVTLRGWLARQGADLSKITFVELDDPATTLVALKKGEIDVANTYTNWRAVAEEQGLSIVLHIDDLVSRFPCCRISTTGANLKARREDYVAFLKGLIRAFKVFNEEHERTLDIVAKYYDATRELQQSQFWDYGHYSFSPDPQKKRVLDFYENMTSIKYAKGGADVNAHVDSTLYGDALAQILTEHPNDPFFLEVKREFDQNN